MNCSQIHDSAAESLSRNAVHPTAMKKKSLIKTATPHQVLNTKEVKAEIRAMNKSENSEVW